ncbi:MAG: T9SS type A sorting domain-containing protein [Prevotellaceae bacterium]|jgi:hypothetical protein|nr:T9SS type A sorting domain-containing protein [Prevotellaceae bacterium]
MKAKFLNSALLFLMIPCSYNALQAQGVYLGSGSSASNNIIWGNTDTLLVGDQLGGSGTVSYTATQGSVALTGVGNKALTATPFTGAGVGRDAYSLPVGSELINAGSNAAVAAEHTTDVAGYSRIWHTAVDMGAYEYQFPRTIILEAQDTGKLVGANDPELTYTLTGDGILKGDSLSVQLVRAAGESEGEYIIDTSAVNILRVATLQDVTTLYNIEYENGIFTVRASPVDLPNVTEKNTLAAGLYPSVTTGMVYLSGVEHGALIDVEVYSATGALLLRQSKSAGSFSIDFSALPAGNLFVKLSSGGKVAVVKVVKQ